MPCCGHKIEFEGKISQKIGFPVEKTVRKQLLKKLLDLTRGICPRCHTSLDDIEVSAAGDEGCTTWV